MMRTQVKAGWNDGGWTSNRNETLAVRTALKAGTRGTQLNHNEALKVRTALKGGQPPPEPD